MSDDEIAYTQWFLKVFRRMPGEYTLSGYGLEDVKSAYLAGWNDHVKHDKELNSDSYSRW